MLLLVLTVATGVIDAVSILSLGRVFVANMTGNVVFIGFALAHAPGFSLQASLVALVAFLLGAGAGGFAVDRLKKHRGRLLRNVIGGELILLLAGLLILLIFHEPYETGTRDVVVACAGAALGLQNAAARSLAVPDMTSTVLTMTLTGIAADIRARELHVAVRRVVAVAAMLVGAAGGAALVLGPGPPTGFAVACGLVAVVVFGAAIAAHGSARWHAPA